MIKRVEKILKDSGLSVNSFARKCNIAQATIAKQLKGERKFSVEAVNAILNAFPDVNANWLMLGIGEPYNQIDANTESLIKVIKLQQDTIDNLQQTVIDLRQQLEQFKK